MSISNKTAINNQINKTLEEMAQAVFKSWFVDFEPVRAKAAALAAGRTLDDANLAAMRAISGKTPKELASLKTTNPHAHAELLATANLFPHSFTPSELGDIPTGWDKKELGAVVEPKKGKTITRKTAIEGDIPVVAGGLEPAYYHNVHNVEAPVVTISASGANAGFVRLYNKNIWASDCSFISKTQTNHIYCIYTLLKFSQKEIYGMQQGAAQPHIYPSDIMRLIVTIPKEEIWNKLETILLGIYEYTFCKPLS
jgi:type I restriction enzyme S subunit